MRYILNSAVVPTPGRYRDRLVTVDDARAWLAAGHWHSTIGYEETAKALEELCAVDIPVDRKVIRMEAGGKALVFRLIFPPGWKRPDPGAKGGLGVDFIRAHCELGVLIREE